MSTIKNVDEKGFPCHFPKGRWGIDHPREQKLTTQEFNNQRFLNEDPRFPKDKAFLFYSQQRQEKEQLESAIQISGQKGKVTGKGSNVELQLHDPCNVMQKLKGSPKYWQNARNELIAKVKQLGPFHLFFTLSCGEMRWIEVYISVVRRMGYKVDIIKDSNGKWSGKDEDVRVEGQSLWDFVDSRGSTRQQFLKGYEFLITRHFDNRVKEFMKNIVMGPGKEKVKIAYYNYRVEFQARGLPHIHGVLWIDKDTLAKEGITGNIIDNPEFVTKLADLTLSCSLPDDDQEIKDIVSKVQKHRHTKSCRKTGKSCRYGFPKLPMPKTVLAQPLPDDMDPDEKKFLLKKAKEVLSKALHQDVALDYRSDFRS